MGNHGEMHDHLDQDAGRVKLRRVPRSWLMKFHAILSLTRDHPEFANQIGLMVIDNRTFLANSTIFAKFIGCKPNSVRLSFRTHHIPIAGSVPSYLAVLLDNPRHWNVHYAQDDLFGINWKRALHYERNPSKPVSTNSHNMTSELDPTIYDEYDAYDASDK
jgi:hypothetical protein